MKFLFLFLFFYVNLLEFVRKQGFDKIGSFFFVVQIFKCSFSTEQRCILGRYFGAGVYVFLDDGRISKKLAVVGVN